MIIEINGKEHFDKVLAEVADDKIVLVDFWAERCGPCRMLKPVLHDMAEKDEGIVLFTVDVDNGENQDLSMMHSVRSIPQVSLYKGGENKDQFVGALPPDQIESFVAKYRD